MSKLPTEFVKAPAAKPARRGKKTAAPLEVDPGLARQLVLALTEDEHRMLEDVRAELARDGEELTLEQLVHRILGEWQIQRTAVVAAPQPAPIAEPMPAPSAADGVIALFRRFRASPRAALRDLTATLRRLSGLPA
jgi:hypothetical protein